jgi:BCD family chlorophyll transporter-like MFS transporter
MPVRETTRISAIWGLFLLLALFAGGALERRVSAKRVAAAGAWVALAGLAAVCLSGLLGSRTVFLAALPILGFGTGLCTTSNLSLMLDMTVPGREGLYMGLWGVANALSRILGSAAGGVLRDLAGRSSPRAGYLAGFGLLLALLAASRTLLPRIDTPVFRHEAGERTPPASVALDISDQKRYH